MSGSAPGTGTALARFAGLPTTGSCVHMVGVCGAGMTPLALALQSAGWRVSGEDRQWPSESKRWLEAGGVKCVESGTISGEAALVVVSSAVGRAHPVREAAASRGLAVVRRGEALAALIGDRPLIAVAGSHGKTTTTAMLAISLTRAGVASDYLLGGLFGDGATPPAVWTGSGPVVAEIDESDGTIGCFSPEILVCVNIDWDHCDHYRDQTAIESAFVGLAARTRGMVLFNAACAVSARILPEASNAECVSFGRGGDFGLVGVQDGERSVMTLILGGRFSEGRAALAAIGEFNAVNATAALAVATLLQARNLSDLLVGFPGVCRRQAELAVRAGITVIEDYAHHPSEIAALLDTLANRADKRLVVIFQPHRHSRTAQFMDAFAAVLSRADRLYLLDVYSAGEVPVAGGSSIDLLEAVGRRIDAPEVDLLSDAAWAADRIASETRIGDLIAFVGAGDIDAVARATAALLTDASGTPAGRTESFLQAFGDRLSPETILRAEEPLGPKTTIRVGGMAQLYAEPANTADLQVLVAAAHVAGIPVHLLGRGSNLIVPDEGVRGLVLRLQHAHWRRFACIESGRYWVGAGLRLKELCGVACRMREGGFEFLEGIPGTVGGALRMNAGAMNGWMFDLVEQIHVLTLDGEFRILPRHDLHVEYRRCAELEGAIAMGAIVRAAGLEESAAIRARIDAYQKTRHASQPREPSAGCIFRNPPGDSAGRIIDQLGLKGIRVGDAEVSRVHGNFIINRGHATGSDVIALVRQVRDSVREQRAIDLEPEALLYGRDWKEVL